MPRSDFKPKQRLIDRLISRRGRERLRRKVGRQIGGPWQAIMRWIELPIKLLFLPGKLIDVFYFRGIQTGTARRRPRSLRRRLKTWWSSAIRIPYHLISTALHRSRRGELVYWLPALIAFLFVGFVGYQLSINNQQIQTRYSEGARQALLDGNLPLANTYFGRLFDRSLLPKPQQLQWVGLLRSAGETQRADRLLANLAPDAGNGYPEAHAIRVIELASTVISQSTDTPRAAAEDNSELRSIQTTTNEELLNQLRTHLQFANDGPDVSLAWAKYWIGRHDIDAACDHLERVADTADLSSKVVTLISQQLAAGNLSWQSTERLKMLRDRSLTTAETAYRQRLETDPLDHQVRIQLAATLVSQSQYDLAKQTLRQGLHFHAAPTLRRGLADVFIVEFQNMQSVPSYLLTQQELQGRTDQLKSAIAADPSYLLPYVCFAKLLIAAEQPTMAMSQSIYPECRVPDDTVDTFRWLITSDHPSPMDHFCLATLHWMRCEEVAAERHLNQARSISPYFAEQAHRLAVALAFFSDTSTTSHLPWAKRLVDLAVQDQPEDADVLLSYGRVLVEHGDVESAIEHLLRALPRSAFPDEVHDALQAAYFRTGDLEQAEKHARLARASRTSRSVRQMQLQAL